MDFIEEKVDAFFKLLRNVSLKKSLAGYVAVACAGVVTATFFTRYVCTGWISVLSERSNLSYSYDGHKIGVQMYLMLRGYVATGAGTALYVAIAIYNYCALIYATIAFLVMVVIFMEKKVLHGVKALKESVDAVYLGDLGHEISYYSEDEIGALCMDFERMRGRLIADKQSRWAAEEAQRRINAAFAHDMRTPLTVIQGYTEFLLKYVPQGKVSEEVLLEKLDTMLFQERRLFALSRTMSTIQEIEKREVHCSWVPMEELERQLRDVLCTVAAEKKWSLQMLTPAAGKRYFDRNLVLEVFDNLLSNAVRYAAEVIEVQLRCNYDRLVITVRDDGAGFSDRGLREGTVMYYSETVQNLEHFGIGLSISRMLCEMHGGALDLCNSIEGGAIVTMSVTCVSEK